MNGNQDRIIALIVTQSQRAITSETLLVQLTKGRLKSGKSTMLSPKFTWQHRYAASSSGIPGFGNKCYTG